MTMFFMFAFCIFFLQEVDFNYPRYSLSLGRRKAKTACFEVTHNASFVAPVFMHFARRMRSRQVSGPSVSSFLLACSTEPKADTRYC